jgi:hypothetical protein
MLSFSCMCLVSSSPSEVGQFSFECCPLVQEISFATTTCPALGGGLLPIPTLSLPCLSCVQVEHSIHPFCCPCLITVCYVFFSFVGGDQSAQGLYWFMFLGVGTGVLHSAWCSPVHSANWHAGRFGAGSGCEEKWCQLFSVQHGVGRLSMS